MIKAVSLIIMLFIALSGLNALCADAPAVKPLLIDVRTEAEWKEGHLEGAILIPYDRIGEGIVKTAPDRNTKINLYCRSGRRSGIALDALKQLGYEDVTNLGSVNDASVRLNIPVVK
ncbi:MAG: rhodanese-like domain-containing protein [Geobacteraceae bacterium]|nr:rhodanese-like domain-containing protein [Geobacteraceae bacterium]